MRKKVKNEEAIDFNEIRENLHELQYSIWSNEEKILNVDNPSKYASKSIKSLGVRNIWATILKLKWTLAPLIESKDDESW